MVAGAPSPVGGVLVTIGFDQCVVPRLGRCDGADALILGLQELDPVYDVGAPAA